MKRDIVYAIVGAALVLMPTMLTSRSPMGPADVAVPPDNISVGCTCTGLVDACAGSGAPGCGGNGGGGGTGGQAGGAAIALFVSGNSSVTMNNGGLVAAWGGNGGQGGNGGGGAGGNTGNTGGAVPCPTDCDSGTTLAGGSGGTGGTGGVGGQGGGGAGGPLCLYAINGPVIVTFNGTQTNNYAGEAGAGGLPNGTSGTTGDPCK